MIEFLSRSDMTSGPSGQSERKYLPRQYLLWTLKGLLGIINGSELHTSNFVPTFSEKLSFSQLYDFIKSHKHASYVMPLRYLRKYRFVG